MLNFASSFLFLCCVRKLTMDPLTLKKRTTSCLFVCVGNLCCLIFVFRHDDWISIGSHVFSVLDHMCQISIYTLAIHFMDRQIVFSCIKSESYIDECIEMTFSMFFVYDLRKSKSGRNDIY